MKKFRELFNRQKAAGKVVAPALPADHEHDVAELPCDMGRKVLRRCLTPGCDFMETVAATAEQRVETAPLAGQVASFLDGILDDVEAEYRKKGRQ
jgi:DNA-binding ferritin-like protein (Dps family)